jgi:hypothetical protein
MKVACLKRGVPYVHFVVGYPNKEHYVIRRVLEELGEIDCFYKDYAWQRCPLESLEEALNYDYSYSGNHEIIKAQIEHRKKHIIKT